MGDGRGLEPVVTRLKGDKVNSEEREGVVVEVHGGKYPNDKGGRRQKGIVEFLCDRDVTGNEGFDEDETGSRMRRREAKDGDDDEEPKEPELPDLDQGKNLEFVSYKREDEIDVLRLRWKTKYACEDAIDKKDPDEEGSKSKGWGFFTWFIIVLFLLVATYIIFGSWLNYNRYGARGWDLIPHGDAIRDVPYIVKDWGTNFVDRLKGGDSRGGYSAV